MTQSLTKPFQKLYLIDGTSYLYRAFFALPHLSTSKGFPTNAIFGFTSMLLKLLREEKPEGLAVVFDGPKPSFRKDLFADYKAHRPPAPQDLKLQIPYVKKILEAMRIPVLELEGFEADDVIATLTEKAKKEGISVVIVSGDKDLLQIVSEEVSLLDTMKNERFTPEKVREKFGVSPKQIPDFLGLVGDQSDNIPGIEGIGPKTAQALLERYNSLESILENLDHIPDSLLKPSLKEKLRKAGNRVLLNKRLAQIRKDIPLEIKWEAFLLGPWDEEKLKKIFEELEFRKFLKELFPPPKTERPPSRLLETEGEISQTLEILKGKEIALCLYASGEDVILQKPIGISIYNPEEGTFFIPIKEEKELERFRGLLENSFLFMHDAKPQIRLLLKEGYKNLNLLGDTALMAYLLDPEAKDYSLRTLLSKYLSVDLGPSRALTSAKGLKKASPLEAKDFACEEAFSVWMLKEKLLQKIEEEGLKRLFYEVELPLVELLAQMELWGVKIDPGILKELSQELQGRLKELESQIWSLSGEIFNLNSPQQVGRILFEKLKLPPLKRTPTKAYSTDTEVLETLAAFHEVPRLLLEHRTLSKLKSTYLDALPRLIHPVTGRLHTSFNQMGTATGRLSSSEPNLQNIPVKGELGERIRRAFKAEEGWLLLSADYSQIELRILAHLSEDEGLIEAFIKERDIHAETASLIFGVPEDQVTSEMRRQAKVVNFGIIYGMTPFGLSKELGVEPEIGKRFIEDYFRKHPKVKSFITRTIEEAKRNGYVRTLFGRKRQVPWLLRGKGSEKHLGERIAINTPIQGSCADIIKMAMLKIWQEIKEKGLPAKLILQVHDELLLEVKEEMAEDLAQRVKEIMEGVVSLKVPLKVNVGLGRNWGEIH